MDSLIAAPPEQRHPGTARTRARTRLPWLVALLGAGALVGLIVWRHSRRPPALVAEAAQPVSIASASFADLPVRLTELGTVTPLTTVTIRSQISGYLTQVALKEGQDVPAGGFLAQVDPRPYQAILDQYEGNLLRDQGQLDTARINLDRYTRLARLDSIAQQNVDTGRAAVAQYEGAVKTDQGQIEAEKLDLLYAHITAPIAGRIGLRLVDPGNYVTPGDATGIAVLTQMQPMSVLFTIPQTALGQVLAQIRQSPLAVSAANADGAPPLASGSVSTIDNQVDTTTGTIKLRAIFPNRDEALFPNAFVTVSLLVETRRHALTVPTESIQHGAPGTYVFLIGADQTVSLRPVRTGAEADGRTEILSGLAQADRVVLEGTSRLRQGTRVTIVAGS